MPYQWDDQLHLFRRSGMADFGYSDGDEIEARLLADVREAADVGTFSPELARRIVDWPSEYHLSRLRHCLLRPLHIAPGSRVLELGAGCGAITRYLGELGAGVVAVEGSLKRASVAAERCRDLPNVRVVVDDLVEFETDDRFDYVLLIGVLEYAAIFSSAANPFQNCLRSATRFLAPGGQVIVAIENKLGLKYFNGCAEDHLGIPFAGVQGLYGERTARTFGRQELLAKLSGAGLPHSYFYYPFPDYKLPVVVISQQATSVPGFNVSDLLARCHARDYGGSPYRSFDDALAWDSLCANGLLQDLSNSFLLLAAPEPHEHPAPHELAHVFSVYRSPEFVTQTNFVADGPRISVVKKLIASKSTSTISIGDGLTFTQSLQNEPYVDGRQILWEVLRARAQSSRMEPIVLALRPWVQFLLDYAVEKPAATVAHNEPIALSALHLPGGHIDCTPFNLLQQQGKLVAIDNEWGCDREIPLGWVLTRGSLWSLAAGVPSGQPAWSFFDLMEGICRDHGLTVARQDIDEWLSMEKELQQAIAGSSYLGNADPRTSSGLVTFAHTVYDLQQNLAARQQHVADGERALAKLRDDNEQTTAHLNRELVVNKEAVEKLRHELSINRKAKPTLRETLRTLLSIAVPSRMKRRLRKRKIDDWQTAVAGSSYFDRKWYLETYPDVAAAGTDPARHYVLYGADERRNPGPHFDSAKYLEQNPDIEAAGVNPLVHFLRYGRQEGRPVYEVGVEKSNSGMDRTPGRHP